MSYNVAVCIAPVPEDDEAAWGRLDDFIAAKGPIPEIFKSLHDRLTSRYPCVCSLPEEEVDEGSGVMVRYGTISVIEQRFWGWCFRGWKRFSRSSWIQRTWLDRIRLGRSQHLSSGQ